MPTNANPKKEGEVIDSLYHCRTSLLRYGNPLGFHHGSAEDMMKVICQNDQKRPNVGPFTERVCLEIALHMRRTQNGMNQFTFWPSHLLFQTQGCMILQKKAFCIQGKFGKVEELSDSEYEKMKRMQYQGTFFLVHELAFGPAYKLGITPPSFYFNLAEEDLIPFPPEKLKLCMDSLRKTDQIASSADDAYQRSSAMLQHASALVHYQPIDDCAFNLVTTMMKYHLQKLKAAELPKVGKCEDHKAHQILFQMNFEQEWKNNKKFWNQWISIPRCKELRVPLGLTEAAHCNSIEYEFPHELNGNTEGNAAFDCVALIWKTFVESKGGTSFCDAKKFKPKRLPIFAKISGACNPFDGNKVPMPLLGRS